MARIQITARISYPHLFTAHAFNNQGEPRFSAAFVFPKDSPTAKKVQAAMAETAKEKWGGRAQQMLTDLTNKSRVCLSDGASKDFPDCYYINASNKNRPTVVDRDLTPLAAEDGKIYGGCWVNASIEIWAQDNQFGKRINATLRGVQFVKDDEAFGGAGPRVAQADEFEAIADIGEDNGAEDAFAW